MGPLCLGLRRHETLILSSGVGVCQQSCVWSGLVLSCHVSGSGPLLLKGESDAPLLIILVLVLERNLMQNPEEVEARLLQLREDTVSTLINWTARKAEAIASTELDAD